MKTFTDRAGRPWSIDVTYATVARVRKALDVNLLDIIDGSLPRRLAADVMLLVDVIAHAIAPARDAAGVALEDFHAAMGGEQIDAATDVLLEAIVDFFPSGQRTILRALLAKTRELEAAVVNVTLDAMESRATAAPSSASDGSSPANSDSPPDPGPSVSAI